MAKTPASFDYTVQFYECLKKEAKKEDFRGAPVEVFRGSVTKVFRDLSISQSYYSVIRKALIDLGCISVVRQGSRNQTSVLILHHPPELEPWENIFTQDLTDRLDNAILTQRVNDLIKSIGGVDVKRALADLGLRMEKVEREVERIGKTPTARRKHSS